MSTGGSHDSFDRPATAGPKRSERRAVADIVLAAVLFGGCNVAWRYGAGPAIGIVGFRALLGAGIAVIITRRLDAGVWTDAMRTREGRTAVLISAAGLVAAGTMFRTLDGQLAALALACTPAVALLLRERSGTVSVVAALGSSAAAIAGLGFAVTDSGVATLTRGGVIAAIVFIAFEVSSIRTTEIAVERGVHPAAIVSATMIIGSIVLVPVGVVFGAIRSPSTIASALGAAFVVALFGTIGRVLRSAAVPVAGVMATTASAQLTALVTAVGGIVLLGDALHVGSASMAAIAAVFGVVAVVSAARWRLAHRPQLAEAIERGLDLDRHRGVEPGS